MSKKTIIRIMVFVVALAAIIASIIIYIDLKIEKQCREYEQALSGETFTSLDINQTAKHGKVTYTYKLYLLEDGVCKIDFSATRRGDNSTFAKNGRTEFTLTGLTWGVSHSDDTYSVYISGNWDWQGWTAGQLDHSMEIVDLEGRDLMLRGTRNKYYELLFS